MTKKREWVVSTSSGDIRAIYGSEKEAKAFIDGWVEANTFHDFIITSRLKRPSTIEEMWVDLREKGDADIRLLAGRDFFWCADFGSDHRRKRSEHGPTIPGAIEAAWDKWIREEASDE